MSKKILLYLFLSVLITNCPIPETPTPELSPVPTVSATSNSTPTPTPIPTPNTTPNITPVPDCSTIVTFPDARLQAVIRNIINKPSGDIYLCDVEYITTVTAYYRQIVDLTGIDKLLSLTYLDLSYNRISDISALSGLTSLTSLYLFNNSISDINALSGLTSLYNLSLQSNSISNIYPLVTNSGINNGDYVNLQSNPLNTVSINTYIPTLQARGVNVTF